MEIKNEIKCFLCNATFKEYNFLQKHINNFHSDPTSVTNQETFDGEKEILKIDTGRTAFTESKITELIVNRSHMRYLLRTSLMSLGLPTNSAMKICEIVRGDMM